MKTYTCAFARILTEIRRIFIGTKKFFLTNVYLLTTLSVNRARFEMTKQRGANSPELFCYAHITWLVSADFVKDYGTQLRLVALEKLRLNLRPI
jgi:hypothetical protein